MHDIAISIVAPSQSTLDGLHMIFGFTISFFAVAYTRAYYF